MINRLIASTLPLFPKRFVWLFSRSYIAGETVDDAMRACRALNDDGMKTTIDILGEFIQNLDEAEKNRDEYLALIDVSQQQPHRRQLFGETHHVRSAHRCRSLLPSYP